MRCRKGPAGLIPQSRRASANPSNVDSLPTTLLSKAGPSGSSSALREASTACTRDRTMKERTCPLLMVPKRPTRPSSCALLSLLRKRMVAHWFMSRFTNPNPTRTQTSHSRMARVCERQGVAGMRPFRNTPAVIRCSLARAAQSELRPHSSAHSLTSSQ
ncbi:hypothetical protein B484DRAFT_447127 [Ochromonadaceae sp. CCMP2298]|nr:hypothetical protein B484DRAFT_447127 [Ochromonadaceae sp. CCMP2298]